MKIHHLAIWVQDIERSKDFYVKYFNAVVGPKYHNPNKNFYSYFLSFDSGAQIEIMHKPALLNTNEDVYCGLSHFSISLGSAEQVLAFTEAFRKDGFLVVSEPRTTGDGYFESVILDPDNIRIELTI